SFLLCCCLLSACVPKPAKLHPNVLFILADDFGWNEMSCSGSSYYETPNLDRLAREGMMFTQAYAACQVCSPSRASILTGTYPTRHGITTWIGDRSGEEWRTHNRHTPVFPPSYNQQLPAEDIVLPEAFQAAGYQTMFCGKWHLGDEGSSPEDHGFDVNIGGYWAGSPRGGYFSPYTNPRLEDGPIGENLSLRLAKETADFIRNRDQSRPFLAYLSFYAVHGPIQTSKAKWQKYRSKAIQAGLADSAFVFDRRKAVRQHQDNPVYAGLVESMDESIGLVLEALERQGIVEETIIVFTSDNGGVSSGDAFSSSMLPLRGGKGRQWEGGIQEPLLMRFPSMIPSGSRCEESIIHMDLYPTLLGMAGLDLLPDQHVDGIDIRPVFSAQALPERELFWHYPHYGNQGGEPSSIIRSKNWKLIRYHEDGREELYNLHKDMGEQHNLLSIHPSVSERLSARLSDWLCATNARFPTADPDFNPEKRTSYLKRQATEVKDRLEAERKQMLTADYQPNKDWWGSQTKD
ncbi:MAG: sulfatase, partial [Bacteroidota bacterium]